jgi:D-alanyl-D-alanine carboxypeptidase
MKKHALEAYRQFLGSWLAYRARQIDIPGFTVTVRIKGKTVFSEAYGVADTASQTRLTTSHLFAMASQTKILTAIAVAKMAEKRLLGLDDRAVDHLPWLGEHSDSRVQHITIRHLLQHSSGLSRDGPNCDYWLGTSPFPDTARLQELILASATAFEPGSSLKYSNLGYALLGQIIAQTSQLSYGAYVAEHILQPLKLTAVITEKGTPPANTVQGYGLPFEHQRQALRVPSGLKTLASAAGLYATTEDICRLITIFHARNPLLAKDTKRLLQKSQIISEGHDAGTEFGLGLEIHEIAGRRLIGHSGHIAGQLTATLYDPDKDIAISVAANVKEAPIATMTRGLFTALYHFLDTAQQSVQSTTFAGRFYCPLATVQIVQSGDSLLVIDPDDWDTFDWPEQLAQINDHQLRITSKGSLFNYGEIIDFNFTSKARRQIVSIRFAGMTLLPDNPDT